MSSDYHELSLIKKLSQNQVLREDEFCKAPVENEIIIAPAFETCCLVVSNIYLYHFPVAWSPARDSYSTFGAILPPSDLFTGHVKLFFNKAFEPEGIGDKARFVSNRLKITSSQIFVTSPRNIQSIVFSISQTQVLAWELVNGVYTNIKILELAES